MKIHKVMNEFETMLNQAKVNAYSKVSLRQPLSKAGLQDYKEAFCNRFGFSKEELESA